MEPTHASFFSGVGGLDMGLERAGWRTVSFSEIDPYASAILAQRWSGVPNLGDIVALADGRRGRQSAERADMDRECSGSLARHRAGCPYGALLWTGGFPCQDLSVAGKRRGLAGARSGLAFAFLDLVGRHRPRFVLLENVPGLLSSHGGRDMAALLGALVELGYGVGYRVLDARYFGVPQRRRRVFILGDSAGGRAGAERAAKVLSVGSRCRRHPPAGIEAGEGVAGGAAPGADIVGQALNAKWAKGYSGPAGDEHHNLTLVGTSPDPGGVRAPDGLAGRLDDRGDMAVPFSETAATVLSPNGGNRTTDLSNELVAYRKATKAHHADDWERWERSSVTDTLDAEAMGAVQAVAILGSTPADDPLLPPGLDSHRYRCCGNGVVADVAEWIGRQLLAAIERAA